MKKPIAILLLILGGAAAGALVAFMTVVLFVMLALMLPVGKEWVLYTVLVLFVYALSYLAKHPRKHFKRQYKVNAPVFIACVSVPSLILSAVLYFTYVPVPLEETDGDPIQLYLLISLISVAVFTLSLIIRACMEVVTNKIESRRYKTARDTEDSEE